MNILALDLGTRTGWAMNLGTRLTSGVESFALGRGESPGMRFLRFNQWMFTQTGWLPNLVIYEQPHHRGGAATEVLVGMSTRVLEICAKLSIDCTNLHSGTLKKHACGSGRASKGQMIAAARVRFRIPFDDDNEADALHLWNYAIQQFGADTDKEACHVILDGP